MFFFFLQRTECAQYLISLGVLASPLRFPSSLLCVLSVLSLTHFSKDAVAPPTAIFFLNFPSPLHLSEIQFWISVVMGTEIRDNLDNFTLVQRGKFHSSELISCFGLDNDHFPSHSDKNTCVIFNFFPSRHTIYVAT